MMQGVANATLLSSGPWIFSGGKTHWEWYAAKELPVPADCTAAFCVAINNDHKIVLSQEERGWSMLGGHIEAGESILEALARECLEEGGFTLKAPELFGYLKVFAEAPEPNPVEGRHYPFPVSYIAYYWSQNDAELLPRTEPKVFGVQSFDLEEIKHIDTTDYTAIKWGWEAFTATTGK